MATALLMGAPSAHAQTDSVATNAPAHRSLKPIALADDSVRIDGEQLLAVDTTALSVIDSASVRHKRNWSTWRPSPKRAQIGRAHV